MRMEMVASTMFIAFVTMGITALYFRPSDTARPDSGAHSGASPTGTPKKRSAAASQQRQKSATPKAQSEARCEKSAPREPSLPKTPSAPRAEKSEAGPEKLATPRAGSVAAATPTGEQREMSSSGPCISSLESPQPKKTSPARSETSVPRETVVPMMEMSTPRQKSTPRVEKSLPATPAVAVVEQPPQVVDKENLPTPQREKPLGSSPAKATPSKGLQTRAASRPLAATPLNLKKLDTDDTAFNESQARRKAMLARIQNTLADVSKTHNRVYGEVAEIRRSYACTATMSHVGSDDDEDNFGNGSFASAPAVRHCDK